MEIKLLTIINKKEVLNLTLLELVGDYYVSIDKKSLRIDVINNYEK